MMDHTGGKARIPDDRWDAAIEVPRRDRVNRTAVLHLDGGKLMRRLVEAGQAGEPKRKDAPPAFIELVSSTPAPKADVPKRRQC
jgi:hypothetical protein